MTVTLKIMGYDKRSERLAVEFDVPSTCVPAVIEATRALPGQTDDFGSIPLDHETVAAIGRHLNRPIHSDYYDWFLEPVAD